MQRKDKEAALNKIVLGKMLERAHAGFSVNKSRVEAENLTSRVLGSDRKEFFREATQQPGG